VEGDITVRNRVRVGHRTLVAAVAVLSGLTVGGCDASQPPTGTAPKADVARWSHQVVGICDAAGIQQRALLAADRAKSDPASTMADVAQLYTVASTAVSKVTQPADAKVNRFVQRLSTVAQAEAVMARAMHAGSSAAQAQSARAARTSFAEAAAALNAKSCADWANQ